MKIGKMADNGFIVLALLIGALIPVQAGINSHLGQYLKTPLQATFVNFLGGLLILIVLLSILKLAFPPKEELLSIPKYLYFGGALGVIFVTAAVFLVPKIGATNFVAASVAGQFIAALVLDHFGLLNLPIRHISWIRSFGVLFLILGVYLCRK